MSNWRVEITGKGIRRAGVDKLASSLKEQYGEGAIVTVQDCTPPESRADRLSHILDRISECVSELEDLKSEVEDHVNNLPEAFADSEMGQKLNEAVDGLDTLISELDSAKDSGESIEFS